MTRRTILLFMPALAVLGPAAATGGDGPIAEAQGTRRVENTPSSTPPGHPGRSSGAASRDAGRFNRRPVAVKAEVITEDGLRRAAVLSADRDVNILIDREIVVTGQIEFPRSESIVRLVGVTPQAGIRFDMRFNGDWAAPKLVNGRLYHQNGLRFDSRQVIIRGLRFSGYETLGAAIKGHQKELLSISDCVFADIGTIQFPPKVVPPAKADDALYNQVIGSHERTEGHISVANCRFERCALNNRDWSHCVYVSARSVVIADNLFDGCGSTFGTGATTNGSVNTFGNHVLHPAEVEDRRGVQRPTYLGGLGPGNVAFMLNNIAGRMASPIWTGRPDPAMHLVDFNDYGDLTYSGHWAQETGVKKIDWPEWQSLGFDRRSSTPHKNQTP